MYVLILPEVVFLQERLFTDPNGHTPGPNLEYILQALTMDGVGAIGSAPYVEATPKQAKMNLEAIYGLAVLHGLALDFHLDYNLDRETEPLIYHLVTLMRLSDHSRHRPHVTVGHATRLQLFTPTEWSKLAASIRDLPLTLVGLPQSDVYMQGRATKDTPLGAPRGTLRVPDLARDHGLQIAMGINNIGNPFTPQGSVDPLSSCSFGAAIFQTATVQDLRTLIVSGRPCSLPRSDSLYFPYLIPHSSFLLSFLCFLRLFRLRPPHRRGNWLHRGRCLVSLMIKTYPYTILNCYRDVPESALVSHPLSEPG